MSDDIISGKDAAKLLGVSYARLYTLMDEGKLTRLDEPTDLIRRAPLRFKRSEVESLKQNSLKKTNVDAA